MNKKWISIIVGLALLIFVGYQNKTVLAAQAEKVMYYSACDKPIPYRIGNIDNRFNITETEFGSAIEEAGDIWSNAYGKQLFIYDPKAVLTVSLVYDERQYLNNQINQLDSKLKDQNNSLKPEIAEYERRSAEFKRRNNALNQQIDHWNSQGGAPEEEYKKLKDEQSALKQEAQALNSLAKELNQSTDAFNEQAQQLNQTVDNYNHLLQYKPEEGIYIVEGDEKKIVIFFNNSRQELIHTLAHEMGHALGLEHLDNTGAIMFSRTNQTTTVSPDDLTSLKEVCRKKSIVELTTERISFIASQLQQAMASRTNN